MRTWLKLLPWGRALAYPAFFRPRGGGGVVPSPGRKKGHRSSADSPTIPRRRRVVHHGCEGHHYQSIADGGCQPGGTPSGPSAPPPPPPPPPPARFRCKYPPQADGTHQHNGRDRGHADLSNRQPKKKESPPKKKHQNSNHPPPARTATTFPRRHPEVPGRTQDKTRPVQEAPGGSGSSSRHSSATVHQPFSLCGPREGPEAATCSGPVPDGGSNTCTPLGHSARRGALGRSRRRTTSADS